jgi:hypothetical protein
MPPVVSRKKPVPSCPLQTIISEPVHTAGNSSRAEGAEAVLMLVQGVGCWVIAASGCGIAPAERALCTTAGPHDQIVAGPHISEPAAR